MDYSKGHDLDCALQDSLHLSPDVISVWYQTLHSMIEGARRSSHPKLPNYPSAVKTTISLVKNQGAYLSCAILLRQDMIQFQPDNNMYTDNYPVRSLSDAAPNVRAQFIRRTYIHLAFALLAFVGLEAILLQLPISYKVTQMIFSSSFGWLMVLGGFMILSWLARSLATSAKSKSSQYTGLGIYVVAQALIFVPLLIIAIAQAGSGILVQAGIMTGLLFAGLTATGFITRKDFSWMGSILTMGFFIALGLIIAGVFFGFDLGFWFSAAMIILASGAILYTTSNIIHHYGEDQYVAAALELFAAVALLLWYVIRILMSRR